MAKKLYAAYGSNINLEQMAYRCPHSTVAGTAMLKGYELQFRHHATIEPNEESEVPVLYYAVVLLCGSFKRRISVHDVNHRFNSFSVKFKRNILLCPYVNN